ncbi:unnamed protein product [Clonostachys rosea]|uniref:Cytochrome P450 n=1 Tax=Bionectria ochroleuca TaxID=29856 RepID=A0ABY6TWH1_BIOOC|nr:unnamed protein product [Clonostachys rosea]
MKTDLLSIILAVGIASVLVKTFLASRSPLNRIPGPWYARFTDLPGAMASMSRQQVQYYHKLHQQYGPYVRVGPRNVFVSDIDSFRIIHKIGGNFLKADYYHYFGPTEAGEPPYGLFQMTDPKDHAQRRKLLGRGFTATSLRAEWEDMVRQKVVDAIVGMKTEAASKGVVDIRRWWMCMASDVVSKVMFGKSFDALKEGKDSQEDPWFELVQITNRSSFLAMQFPLLYNIMRYVPIINRASMFHAHEAMMSKGDAAVQNSKAAADGDNANIFAKVRQQTENDDSLTKLDIQVEAGSFMIAGTDTTSNTLTYLVWAVLSRPDLQSALEDEVSALGEGFTDSQLEKLPLLHAVIEETLRLYGAAPTPLPRIVPPGGARLGGYDIPAGTEVATQSFTMHRDPKIFDDPERYDVERWLPGGSCTISPAAKAAFTPFGAGSRVCIGQHLAYMELRFGAALFFRECRGAKLDASTTPESMEMRNLVLIEPKGKVCNIVL